MPAKELSEEQRADAKRLKACFKAWQVERKAKGLPSTQDEVAEALFGFGQSALSQYLNGVIPLNMPALVRFASVLQVQLADISPHIVQMERDRAMATISLLGAPAPQPVVAAPAPGKVRTLKVDDSLRPPVLKGLKIVKRTPKLKRGNNNGDK